MNLKPLVPVLLAALVLAACAPAAKAVPTRTATPTSTWTIDQIRGIIYASNPASPQYDPQSTAYARFPEAIEQLPAMADAIDAAGDLAIAITYPRQDSHLAAQLLLTLGADITSTTIVTLFGDLDPSVIAGQKPTAIIDALILLSSTGSRATCAVGNIGPLLWQPDPKVRSEAAFALEKITGKDLLAGQYEFEITPSFTAASISADEPQGSISGAARQWWEQKGAKVKWHASYGFCDP